MMLPTHPRLFPSGERRSAITESSKNSAALMGDSDMMRDENFR